MSRPLPTLELLQRSGLDPQKGRNYRWGFVTASIRDWMRKHPCAEFDADTLSSELGLGRDRIQPALSHMRARGEILTSKAASPGCQGRPERFQPSR